MFIPLLKADAAQRLVYGRLDETPDRAGEIFDYASSKPMFEKWSETARTASGGKSLGNIRAMHGRTAAGRLDAIDYDDAAKAIEICAHIVDDAEWEKIEAGVYTGFSPGGRYAKRWPDGAYTRYTADPAEISVADVPCIPSATFTCCEGRSTLCWWHVSLKMTFPLLPTVQDTDDQHVASARRHCLRQDRR